MRKKIFPSKKYDRGLKGWLSDKRLGKGHPLWRNNKEQLDSIKDAVTDIIFTSHCPTAVKGIQFDICPQK
jgi:hypothetical protein